jgi:hypothetical protein
VLQNMLCSCCLCWPALITHAAVFVIIVVLVVVPGLVLNCCQYRRDAAAARREGATVLHRCGMVGSGRLVSTSPEVFVTGYI